MQLYAAPLTADPGDWVVVQLVCMLPQLQASLLGAPSCWAHPPFMGCMHGGLGSVLQNPDDCNSDL